MNIGFAVLCGPLEKGNHRYWFFKKIVTFEGGHRGSQSKKRLTEDFNNNLCEPLFTL